MLIPVFGLYGAIIALNVPFMLIGFTLLIIGIKKYPIPIEWRRLKVAVSVLAGVLLLNFVLRTTDNVSYCWISLTAMFAVGVVLCSGIFFDYREKALAKSFLNEIRTRVRA